MDKFINTTKDTQEKKTVLLKGPEKGGGGEYKSHFLTQITFPRLLFAQIPFPLLCVWFTVLVTQINNK